MSKISVIIPVKNRAELIIHTLENILAQDVIDLEVIVVDDGSTDGIERVIEKYSDRIFFTKNRGKGPGAARNTGFKLSTGDLIQFFDSDDLMTRNKLKVQSTLLESTNSDFIYGPYVKASQSQDSWTQRDVIMQYLPLPKGRLAEKVLQGWCPITQSVLFTRGLIERAGPWRDDLMPHEDYEFWFRVAKLSQKYVHENQSCVIYRQHNNQITDQAVADKERWYDGLKAMRLIANQIDFKPSLQSLLLFSGRYSSSYRAYSHAFGRPQEDPYYSSAFAIAYYKLHNKIGRFLTKSGWQKIHGISADEAHFNHYLSLL